MTKEWKELEGMPLKIDVNVTRAEALASSYPPNSLAVTTDGGMCLNGVEIGLGPQALAERCPALAAGSVFYGTADFAEGKLAAGQYMLRISGGRVSVNTQTVLQTAAEWRDAVTTAMAHSTAWTVFASSAMGAGGTPVARVSLYAGYGAAIVEWIASGNRQRVAFRHVASGGATLVQIASVTDI